MYSTNQNMKGWLLALAILLGFSLAACGSAGGQATPTVSVAAIYTSAVQTFEAQQATQLALTPPTNTPAPTATLAPTLPSLPSPIATLAFATAVPGTGGKLCDSSAYVSDVTIPDDTVVSAGKSFKKTWRLVNNGSCTWGTGYKLAFDSGDQMGGAAAPVTVPVPASGQIDISVNLTAPSTNGTYKGNWRMQNASGQAFGNLIYVQIKVGSGSTSTPGPSPTPGGSGTFTISGSINVADVTIEIDTINAVPDITYTTNGYTFTVPAGWSGTITPSKGKPGHWTFTPASRTFTNVSSNQGQDFTGVPVTPTSP